MKLPDCHSRRLLEKDAGVFFCAHPRVHARGHLVTAEFCKLCRHWAEPAPESFRPFRPESLQGQPCVYLGEQIRLDKCVGCRGSVRVKVFACGHPLHRDTTLRHCEGCADFEPPLTKGAVSRWAVGVTTAPREAATLQQFLASLAGAGFERPLLFAEPQTKVPDDFPSNMIVRRSHRLGAVGNWLVGLAELLERYPEADAYFMLQDDVVLCRNVRRFLDQTLWPSQRVGLVSPYCPAPYAGKLKGLGEVAVGRGLIGALTTVLPPSSARQLLAYAPAIRRRWTGYHEGGRRLDWLLGRWASHLELPVYCHSPSLAQHIGDCSTVWPAANNRGRRRATNFLGQGFDASQLTPASVIRMSLGTDEGASHAHQR